MVRKAGRPGWYFRREEGGKTKWRALGTDYEAACRKLRELKKRDCLERSDLTVADAAKQWLESHVSTNRREEDHKLAAQRIRDYLAPHLGHLLLERVKRKDLRDYRQKLLESHLSTQSVRHILSDARCLLRWCEDTGLIDRPPIPLRW